MSRYYLLLLGMLLGLCSAVQAVEDISIFYNGEKQLPRRIVMGFWGYRPVGLTEVNPFVPFRLAANRRYYGLKILTLGRYEGVRFDFMEPLNLAPFIEDKDIFLEIYLRSSQGSIMPTTLAPLPVEAYPGAYPPGAYPPGMMPGEGVLPPGAYPGVRPPRGPMVPRPPGAPPLAGEDEGPPPGLVNPTAGVPRPVNPPVEAVPNPQPEDNIPNEMIDEEKKPLSVPLPQLKNIRITFYTEKGVGMLMVTPEQFYPKEEVNNFWVRIGIPLSQIQKGMPIGGKLNRMVVTSDEPTEFLVGRLAFVRDNKPMVVNLFIFPPFLEAKKSIFFAARVEAGLTPYEVQWDFDTRAGESVDAVGERVTYTYPAEGLYTITCTVRDLTGAKPPVINTIDVKISRPFEE